MEYYQAIGLMSGTSLDGVDIACCLFTCEHNIWIYKILNATTIPYPAAWKERLAGLLQASGGELIETHNRYGSYLGGLVKAFVAQHGLQPDFVSSHGHTVFHQPERQRCFQVGSGAFLAAEAGLPVICDFRSLDIALQGQGAPLVPIGDRLLFAEYDFCLNLGGIANISMERQGQRLAFDICACNLALNYLVEPLGLAYDAEGAMARSGQLRPELLARLNAAAYYAAPAPKSLGREWVEAEVLAVLDASAAPLPDKLLTTCHHIAFQIARSLPSAPAAARPKLLLTGGGARHTLLVELISAYAAGKAEVVVPEPELIDFKEALVFAFLGVLRWRQEVNCLASVTGARTDSVGGAIYRHRS